MITKNKTLYLANLLVLLLAGCSASTGNMYAPAECPRPSYASDKYTIGPGDMLNVVVWRHEELTATIPVRPDGKISMPLVDDMMASGKTPSELSRDIKVVLAEFLRTPEVSIIVTGQGAANQVQVVGEVVLPKGLSYRDGLKILDIIVAAGGLTEFAAGNRAHLVRPTAVGHAECRVFLKDLMSGDMSSNILVYPGDVLVVPESTF